MVIDIFKYFAQFVPQAVLLELFDENKLNDAVYDDLKAYVEALTDPILPGIDKFIISQDEDAIKDIVNKTDGYLMMVEYSVIQGDALDQMGMRDMSSSLSVTIAHHFKNKKLDHITEAVLMQRCLDMMKVIVSTMTEDNSVSALKDYAQGSITIGPLGQGEGTFGLYGSVGYIMTFDINNKGW